MYECAPARRYERVYVYNKVFGTQISAKQGGSVKILLINNFFFEKYLVEWKIVCTFALAFEKYNISSE